MNLLTHFFSNRYSWIFLFAILFIAESCRRDEIYEGQDVEIAFSVDTLRIDTVFTTIGSATRFFKVYNRRSQPILADFELKNKNNKFFRVNVDGSQGPLVKNVEIAGNDSIYIFVEVTVDPDQPLSVSPFVIEDQIDVSVNGRLFTAYLEAWGQNANYITPSNGRGKGFLYSCDFGERIWNDPKPYVIYGILYVDSCKVVMPAGTRVYVHGGIVRDTNTIYNDGLLVFLKNGTLETRGTPEDPVIIQGDRLEKEFENVKSQWVGLLFWQESQNHVLEHTIIKNSIIGLRVDSLAQLSLSGCSIYNTGGPAIIGRHANIYAENCLMYDNSTYGMQLTYGGNYTFNYCTVGSYEGQNESVILTDFYTTDPLCGPCYRVNDLNASFTNCIFAGTDKDEIGLAKFSKEDGGFNYQFTNCAVKVNELTDPKNFPNFFDFCENCINLKNNDRVFNNQRKDDYRLDTMSVALGKGISIPTVIKDILGKPRKPTPDLGCFEF